MSRRDGARPAGATEPDTVGILGGTFDPVHLGHLALAAAARRELGLQRVALMPVAVPPHKPAHGLTPAREREAMLRLALAGRPGLELCRFELEARRVCYTIETLRTLAAGPPAVRPLFLLGFDALREIETWRESAALLREFDLAFVGRAVPPLDDARDELPAAVAARLVALDGPPPAGLDPGRGGRVFRLPFEPVQVSSSEIRERARDGRELTDLVPPAVARYIQRTGLYRRESRR